MPYLQKCVLLSNECALASSCVSLKFSKFFSLAEHLSSDIIFSRAKGTLDAGDMERMPPYTPIPVAEQSGMFNFALRQLVLLRLYHRSEHLVVLSMALRRHRTSYRRCVSE